MIFRVIHVLATVRLIANGTSLVFQFCYPNSAFKDRGNKQLFIRSLIQASGTPINLLRGILKPALLTDTVFERDMLESYCDLTRAVFLVPIASVSLFHQWYTTEVP